MSQPLAIVLTATLFSTALYAAHKSYIAIVNLRKYEERSERAAKHSETAAEQLYKTRVTQASSAAAIALSLISAGALFLGGVLGSSTPSTWAFVLPPTNVVATTAAFIHNRNFWKSKAKVPFVQGFSEGIEKSKEIRQLLILLGLGWGVVGALQWI